MSWVFALLVVQLYAKEVHFCSFVIKSNHPSPLLQNKSWRHMNPVINDWFPQHQPSSVQVKSPQATFTDHHKQDFSLFLAPTSNYKAIKFSPHVSLNVNRTTISPTIMRYRTPELTVTKVDIQGKYVWLIAPHALRFSQNKLHVCQNLIFTSSFIFNSSGWLFAMQMFFPSKMFHCHCQLNCGLASLLNVCGCFPSFLNGIKILSIVTWPSGWKNWPKSSF